MADPISPAVATTSEDASPSAGRRKDVPPADPKHALNFNHGMASRRPPRGAAQLVDMVQVKEPLTDLGMFPDNGGGAGALPGSIDGMIVPVVQGHLSPLDVYDASADPFLKQYWKRKNALPEIWKKQKDRHKQPAKPKAAGSLRLHPSTPLPASSSHALPGGTSEEKGTKRAASAADFASSSQRSNSPHSRRSPSEGGASAVVFHEAVLNRTPMQPIELLALRTVLMPRGNWVSNIPIPHCDLSWMRTLLAKTPESVGTAADFSAQAQEYRSHATKNLNTLNFSLLENDAAQYGDDHSLNATILNSPRSIVVLLRSGLCAYELLKRPPAFYLKVGEVLSRDRLTDRHAKAEANRVELVLRLQQQYEAACASFSPEDVFRAFMDTGYASTDASTGAVVKKLREKSDTQFHRMQKRITGIAELEASRKRRAAEKAVEMSHLLQERAEAKRQQIAEKAEQLAQTLEKRQRVQQCLTEVLAEQAAEQAKQIYAKHDRVAERYEQLKKQRQDEGAKQRDENITRLERSRSLVQQRDEDTRQRRAAKELEQQQIAEQHRERVKQEREAAAKRYEETAEKQELFKSRAEEQQRRTREMIEQRLDDAERRLEDFRQRQEEAAAVRSVLHEKREAHLRSALEAAKIMEEQTALRVLQQLEESEARLKEKQERSRTHRQNALEEQIVERETKLHVVDAVRKKHEFDNLIELARMQQREMQVSAFERAKQDAAQAAADSRTKLRILHHELNDGGEMDRVRVERAQAVELYEIEHPKAQYPTVCRQFRDVPPRIDAGLRSRSPDPALKRSSKQPQASASAASGGSRSPDLKKRSPRKDADAEATPNAGATSSHEEKHASPVVSKREEAVVNRSSPDRTHPPVGPTSPTKPQQQRHSPVAARGSPTRKPLSPTAAVTSAPPATTKSSSPTSAGPSPAKTAAEPSPSAASSPAAARRQRSPARSSRSSSSSSSASYGDDTYESDVSPTKNSTTATATAPPPRDAPAPAVDDDVDDRAPATGGMRRDAVSSSSSSSSNYGSDDDFDV